MKIALFSYTDRGERLRSRLERELLAAMGAEISVTLTPEEAFDYCDALIFIGAAGIAVRKIAPLVRDKFTDPAVLSIDEYGRYCVPLLSGHVGGGNAMARQLSALIGSVPVISTATDLNGVFAVDLFAARHQLVISDRRLAKEISAALLRGESVGFSSEFPVQGELPEGLYPEDVHPLRDESGLHIFVTVRRPAEEQEDTHQGSLYTGGGSGAAEKMRGNTVLRLIPRCLCLGVGCRKNAAPERVKRACNEFLRRQGIAREAVGIIASIALKEREPALLALREYLSASFSTFSAEALQVVPGSFGSSPFVAQTTGVGNVCERAAAAVYSAVLVKKTVVDGVTFALSVGAPTLYFQKENAKEPISEEQGAEEGNAKESDFTGTSLKKVNETKIILITGGAFQGKHRFAGELAKKRQAEREEPFAATICEVAEELLVPLADLLLEGRDAALQEALRETVVGIGGNKESERIVILRTEGNGVVPTEADERARREVRGRLGCLIAEAAEEVWELNCGIPRRLK